MPVDWSNAWYTGTFPELALRIFSLHIDLSEMRSIDLRESIERMYSLEAFRVPIVTPLVTSDEERQFHTCFTLYGFRVKTDQLVDRCRFDFCVQICIIFLLRDAD